jgi:hypothetical protein
MDLPKQKPVISNFFSTQNSTVLKIQTKRRPETQNPSTKSKGVTHQIFKECSNTKFHENVQWQPICSIRTDGQTETTQLTASFR